MKHPRVHLATGSSPDVPGRGSCRGNKTETISSWKLTVHPGEPIEDCYRRLLEASSRSEWQREGDYLQADEQARFLWASRNLRTGLPPGRPLSHRRNTRCRSHGTCLRAGCGGLRLMIGTESVKILVIEDHEVVCRSVKQILKENLLYVEVGEAALAGRG
jgi:hypothetical protein